MIFSGYLGYLSEAGRWNEIITVFGGKTFRQLDFDPYIWDLVGQAYLHTGDLENALSFCERAVAIDEDHSISYANLGSIHFQIFNSKKDPEELSKASLNFEKALKLDPEIGSAHDGLGLIYMVREDYEGAIRHLESALKLWPDSDHTVYNLGMACFKNGNRASALFYFNEFKNTPSYAAFSPEEKKTLDKYIDECRARLRGRPERPPEL
jgi:tetratricopeptide (TPR) repeat protein